MNIVFPDQPVYAKVMGRMIRIECIIGGTQADRDDEANRQMTANPELALLVDTGIIAYLARKDDLGIAPEYMEAFRT